MVYADDVVLLANSPEDANFIYDKFKCLIDKHKLKINELKSKYMIFRVSNNVLNTILDKILLETVDKYLYLGNLLTYNQDNCLFNDLKDVKPKSNKFY